MGVIAQSVTAGPGQRPLTGTVLTASDTFTYSPGTRQRLLLVNGTGGSLTPTIGSGAATASFPGVPSVTTTSYTMGAIAAGAAKMVDIDSISAYCVSSNGTVTVSAGTGLTAYLLSDS